MLAENMRSVAFGSPLPRWQRFSGELTCSSEREIKRPALEPSHSRRTVMDQLIQYETHADSGQSEMSDLTEAQAIQRVQEGDAKAFELIYRLHSGRVYALCLRIMRGNASEAEDLTQEAFLQVFRKIGTFRAEAAFSTWLHRLTFNIALMRLRKKTVGETSLDETIDPDEETSGVRKEFGAPDLRLSGLIDRVNLKRAVEQLPSGYKSVFLLHDVKGYEHNEIGRILGCSIGNSKSQLHKARVLLRELLLEGKRVTKRRRHRKLDERSPGCKPCVAVSAR
jgi:RNA polymerase sigma-70 factor (ECF subfamily)